MIDFKEFENKWEAAALKDRTLANGNSIPEMPERAETGARKEMLIEIVLEVWKQNPELRLGQLLQTVVEGGVMFFTEDKTIAESLIKYQNQKNMDTALK